MQEWKSCFQKALWKAWGKTTFFKITLFLFFVAALLSIPLTQESEGHGFIWSVPVLVPVTAILILFPILFLLLQCRFKEEYKEIFYPNFFKIAPVLLGAMAVGGGFFVAHFVFLGFFALPLIGELFFVLGSGFFVLLHLFWGVYIMCLFLLNLVFPWWIKRDAISWGGIKKMFLSINKTNYFFLGLITFAFGLFFKWLLFFTYPEDMVEIYASFEGGATYLFWWMQIFTLSLPLVPFIAFFCAFLKEANEGLLIKK